MHDRPSDVIDSVYTVPTYLEHMATRHAKDPSPIAFVASNQGKTDEAMQTVPAKININCYYGGCGHHEWHSYDGFVGCILGRGDTVDDAKRLWFGKKQSLNQRDLALEHLSKNALPKAHVIECWYEACPYYGIHTLGRLIGCITSAGRPLEDSIRCWNHHVDEAEQVPLEEVLTPVRPIEPSAPPHTEQAVLDVEPDCCIGQVAVDGAKHSNDVDVGLVDILKIELMDCPDVPLQSAYDALHPMVLGDMSQILRIRKLLSEYKEYLEANPLPVPTLISGRVEYDSRFVKPEPVPVPELDGMASYEQYAEDFSYARGSHHIRNIAAGKYRGKSEWYGQHLPGHRRPARLDCGHYQKRGDLHGDARFSHDVRLWCHERDCTTCYPDGVRKFGIATCETLWAFKMACHSDAFLCKESGPLHQYVYSLGPKYAELAKTKKGRTQNRAMLFHHMANLGRICTRCIRDSLNCVCNRLSHVDGRCTVCKRRSSSCKCVDSAYHTGGLHGGGVIYHACRFDNDCPAYGPHYHVICMGYVNVKGWRKIHKEEIAAGLMCSTPEAELEKTQGILIKRIKRRGANPCDERFMDIESKSELGGLTYYLGTHNTKAKGEHGVVYYGTAANNRFGIKKVRCHDPDSIRKFEDWYNKRLRTLNYGGKRYDLTHARVQRVDIKDGEDETRYDWKFGAVEILGRNKANLGDELFEYLKTQISSHAYDTRSVKAEYRAPFSEYFAEMAKQAKEAGEDVDDVVTVPANAKSNVVGATKSAPYEPSRRSIVMELTYSRQVPASGRHKEKQHVVYCVLDIDPSLVGLCPACFEPMQVMVPLSGVHPRPPDVSGIDVKLDMDAEKWAIWDRSLDRGKGMPFIRKSGIIQEWSFNLLNPHPFERDLTPGLAAQVAMDYVMAYARLYARYDNTTFIELYDKHLAKHQWEPDEWEWNKMRKKATDMSIANALGYLQKYNVPVCEPTYYARKYVEDGVVEAVEPMRWVLNYVSSVWQWLGVNVKPTKVKNVTPSSDPPPFKPATGETFQLASMYYRGGRTDVKKDPIDSLNEAVKSSPSETGNGPLEQQSGKSVGEGGCGSKNFGSSGRSYTPKEMSTLLDDLEGKNGPKAKELAECNLRLAKGLDSECQKD